MGRSTLYTPEIADRICDLMVCDHMSLRAICRQYDDMPDVSTVVRWLASHEDFAHKYAHAREALADGYASETVEIADTEEDASRARNRILARQWFAEKLKPKVYGAKSSTVVSGPDGGAIPLEVSVNVNGIRASHD